MFARILVPLDGSPLGERALPPALALASASAGRLLLLRSATAHDLPNAGLAQRHLEALRAVEAYLEQVASRVEEEGCPVETLVRYGDPCRRIVEDAHDYQADLIVMSADIHAVMGHGGLIAQVLSHSRVPVLLVPAQETEARRVPFSQRPRLLVPLSGSAYSEWAAPAGASLARRLKGGLVLMRAVPPPDLLCPPGAFSRAASTRELEIRLGEARRYLDGVRAQLSTEELEITVDTRVGLPPRAIADASREHGAALVVMATRARLGEVPSVLAGVGGALLRRDLPLVLFGPRAVEELSAALRHGGRGRGQYTEQTSLREGAEVVSRPPPPVPVPGGLHAADDSVSTIL